MENIMIDESIASTDTLKIIYERRAVRRYTEQLVDRRMIEKVLDAGRMAPSAKNRQPWKFYVLSDRKTIHAFSKEIAKAAIGEVFKSSPVNAVKVLAGTLTTLHVEDLLKGPDPVFYNAPVVIFIAAPKNEEWAALDVGMCTQNMLLAAKAMGLDSCPLGIGKYVEQTPVYSSLQVPADEQIHLSIILGYGNEHPSAQERHKENAVFIKHINYK